MLTKLRPCKGLLEGVLFANIRFHDTASRGRLLNRFGKDFEGMDLPLCLNTVLNTLTFLGIDSSLPDNFGRSVFYAASVLTTFVTVSVVGGPLFILAAVIFAFLYYSSECFDPSRRVMPHASVIPQLARYVASWITHGPDRSRVHSAKVYGQTSRDMRRLGT